MYTPPADPSLLYKNNEIPNIYVYSDSDAKAYKMRFPIQSTARHCYNIFILINTTTGSDAY